MQNIFFETIESLEDGQSLALQSLIDELNFTDNGLIPVITQDVSSKDVLMLAWMNREAINTTLSTGLMTYWSRSRRKLWVKGETSGNGQVLATMQIDCDGDALLCMVSQTGVACHTGRDNCFYFKVDRENMSASVQGSPKNHSQ
jgi:phosphoribosyl-AMP cyclohydrolase